MPAIGQVNTLNKVLVGEEFEETEHGGSTDAKAALFSIGQEIGGGEVPLAAGDQGGELTPRSGEANPRLVKRFEQLSCHEGILPELRLSLITLLKARNRASRASAGMILL
jgi:hypothetical protein